MGCFGSKSPTYTPPTPIPAATGTDLYNQGQDWYQKNQPGLFNAQSTALQNANDPNYYSKFQPTSFEQAMGNQYFQNVWPDTQAFMKNQLSQSGFINSPGAAQAMGNTYGNLKMGIGQYLSTQGDNRATNALNAGLGIHQTDLLNPFVNTAGNQSNLNTGMQNQYQQALAQQQYQQAMNQYQQQQSMAQALGYISPVAGNIYNATQGNLGSGLQGTMNSFQQALPFMMSGAGGFGGMFGGGASGQAGMAGTQSAFGGGMPLAGYGGGSTQSVNGPLSGANPYA